MHNLHSTAPYMRTHPAIHQITFTAKTEQPIRSNDRDGRHSYPVTLTSVEESKHELMQVKGEPNYAKEGIWASSGTQSGPQPY